MCYVASLFNIINKMNINFLNANGDYNCTVYPDSDFKYSNHVSLSVISLSSIGLFANVFLIVSYSLNVFYRQKSK